MHIAYIIFSSIIVYNVVICQVFLKVQEVFLLIGDILNKTRKSRGISARQMADHIDVSVRVYRFYESNGRTPSIYKVVMIAEKLNVTTDYLLRGIGELDGESGN